MKTASSFLIVCCFVIHHVKADAIALALSDPRARPSALARAEPDPSAWPYVLPLPAALPFPDGEDSSSGGGDDGGGGGGGGGPLSLMINLLGTSLGPLLDPITGLLNQLLQALGLG